MTTKSTSFRLSASTLTLLKQLAEKENRSLTNMVETLIRNRAKREGMQMPEEVDCTHEWRETDSQFNNVCVKCDVPGERDEKTGKVVSSYLTPWPILCYTLLCRTREHREKALSRPWLSSPTPELVRHPPRGSLKLGTGARFKGSRK